MLTKNLPEILNKASPPICIKLLMQKKKNYCYFPSGFYNPDVKSRCKIQKGELEGRKVDKVGGGKDKIKVQKN